MSASTTRICVKKWLKCENGTTVEEEMRVGNRFMDEQKDLGISRRLEMGRSKIYI